jgi:hypothetical protein
MRINRFVGSLFAGTLLCSQAGRAENPEPQNPIVFRSGGVQTQRFSWPREAGSVQVNGLIMTTTASSTRWVTVRYRTMAEPPLPAPGAFGGGVLRDQNTVHRILFDKSSQSWFGYDLVVSGDVASGSRVSFSAAEQYGRYAWPLRLRIAVASHAAREISGASTGATR